MICKNCGRILSEYTNYCQTCGTRVKEKSSMKGTVAIILVFCIIAVGAISIYYYLNPSLTGTWVCTNVVDGYPDGIVIYEDGTAIVDGRDCNWEIEGELIYFTDLGILYGNLSYTYKLIGHTLYLDGFKYKKAN